MDGDSHIRNGMEPRGEPRFVWPADPLHIPEWVYTNEEIYRREIERIFLGPHWNFVGLECEVPEPGSFIRSFVGPFPVVVARDMDGEIHVFENRCVHRGAEFCRDYRGKADSFICPYHNWTYNLKGDLTAVPFRRGIKGKGGVPKDFDMAEHGLRTFRVTKRGGVVFATASDDTEPLEQYLGPEILAEYDDVFDGDMKLLGIHRNIVPSNWKLYQENLKDPYHALLLHTYLTTFGLFVTTNESKVFTDASGRHHASLSRRPEGRPEVSAEDEEAMKVFRKTMQLNDPRVTNFIRESDSNWSGSVVTIFPTLTALRQTNILNTRLLVPCGPNEFVMLWAVYGRVGDDEEMTRHRLRQNNIFGPGGFLGIEDNEALKFVQDGLKQAIPSDVVMPFGSDDEDLDAIITERALRGMYRYYRDAMGL